MAEIDYSKIEINLSKVVINIIISGGTPFFCKNIYNYLIINKKVLYKYKKRLLKLI